MAIYNISPTGTKTSGVSTLGNFSDSNCYPSPSAVAALNPSGGPHFVYILSGFYVSPAWFTGSGWAGATLIGVKSDMTNAGLGEVTISYSGYVLKKPTGVFNVNNISLFGATNSYSLLYNSEPGLTLNNCLLLATPGQTNSLSEGYNGNIVTYNRCKILSVSTGIALNTGVSHVLNSCILGAVPGGFSGRHIRNMNSNCSVIANDCTFEDSGVQTGILCTAGSITINNSILRASSEIAAPSYIAENAGGVITINNSMLIASWMNPETYFLGTVIESDNVRLQARYKKSRRQGIIVPCVDDSGGSVYARGVGEAVKNRGKRATWYVSPKSLPEPHLTNAKNIIADDVMEVGMHGGHHMELTRTTDFTVSIAGGTIDIDRDADTITLSNGGVISGFKALSTTTIRTTLATLGAIVSDHTYYPNNTGEQFADTSGPVSCNTPYAMPLHIDTSCATGIFHEELVVGKTVMKSSLGITPRVLATPYGNSSASVAEAAKNAGFDSSRPGFLNISTTFASWKLSNVDLYNVVFIAPNFVFNASDVETKRRARQLCENVAQGGHIVFLLAHSAEEATIDQWNIVLDVFDEYTDVLILSHSQAVDYIRSNSESVDGKWFSRSFTALDNDADYHLDPTSPCLGTGTKITGINKDIEGNPLFPPYNIGPCGLAEGALGVAPVANYGAPRNNITRLTGTSTTIHPAGTYILDDTNGWRVVTGWTAGVPNDFFDADGVPIPFTGQQLIDAGIGYQLYYGQKGVAGYTIEQDAKSHKKIVRFLRVNTYIDSILYDPDQDYNW